MCIRDRCYLTPFISLRHTFFTMTLLNIPNSGYKIIAYFISPRILSIHIYTRYLFVITVSIRKYFLRVCIWSRLHLHIVSTHPNPS